MRNGREAHADRKVAGSRGRGVAGSAKELEPFGARLLTVHEAARFLGISVRTIRAHIALGKFPVVRVSPRCLRVDPQDLASFVEQRRSNVDGKGGARPGPTGVTRRKRA